MLKLILPEIISPTQNAFAPSTLISGNIIVAYESMHTMNNEIRRNMSRFVTLKLNMSKAYDKME